MCCYDDMRLYLVLDMLRDDVISVVILSTLLMRIHQNRVAVFTVTLCSDSKCRAASCCRLVRVLMKSSEEI